ncbi:hypothetical protein Hanom_Chr00s089373g01798231 [Helianthus anomalus]
MVYRPNPTKLHVPTENFIAHLVPPNFCFSKIIKNNQECRKPVALNIGSNMHNSKVRAPYFTAQVAFISYHLLAMY